MLVFGAVQFNSSNDGGLEIIHNGTHEYLSREDVKELTNWLAWHNQREYNNRIYGAPVEPFNPANMAAMQPAPQHNIR